MQTEIELKRHIQLSPLEQETALRNRLENIRLIASSFSSGQFDVSFYVEALEEIAKLAGEL